jgi:hypothetical protein
MLARYKIISDDKFGCALRESNHAKSQSEKNTKAQTPRGIVSGIAPIAADMLYQHFHAPLSQRTRRNDRETERSAYLF